MEDESGVLTGSSRWDVLLPWMELGASASDEGMMV